MKSIVSAALFAASIIGGVAVTAVAPAEAAFVVPTLGVSAPASGSVQQVAYVTKTVRTHVGPRGRVCRKVVRTIRTRHGMTRSVRRVCR